MERWVGLIFIKKTFASTNVNYERAVGIMLYFLSAVRLTHSCEAVTLVTYQDLRAKESSCEKYKDVGTSKV